MDYFWLVCGEDPQAEKEIDRVLRESGVDILIQIAPCIDGITRHLRKVPSFNCAMALQRNGVNFQVFAAGKDGKAKPLIRLNHCLKGKVPQTRLSGVKAAS